MKATEQYFPVVLFINLYKVVLTFESVEEIRKFDHSPCFVHFNLFSFAARCYPECQNGGTCIRRNTCMCARGYFGYYCQYGVVSIKWVLTEIINYQPLCFTVFFGQTHRDAYMKYRIWPQVRWKYRWPHQQTRSRAQTYTVHLRTNVNILFVLAKPSRWCFW